MPAEAAAPAPEGPESTSAIAELDAEPAPQIEEKLASLSVNRVAEASSRGRARMAAQEAKSKAAPPERGAKTETNKSPSSGAPEQAPPAPTSSGGRTPLLVYTATVAMAVFGLDTALDAVEELARAHQGYLVRRTDTSITVRVPPAVFRDTLAGVGKLGDELHRDVNVRDVTEEYTDLEIRLRNAEVVRERLETLLAKANGVDDALSVERELARVTGSIEELKGKLKLLSEIVAFSTITVNFERRGVEHVNAEHPLPFDWLKELGLSNLLAL
jgi:hypothetical protein